MIAAGACAALAGCGAWMSRQMLDTADANATVDGRSLSLVAGAWIDAMPVVGEQPPGCARAHRVRVQASIKGAEGARVRIVQVWLRADDTWHAAQIVASRAGARVPVADGVVCLDHPPSNGDTVPVATQVETDQGAINLKTAATVLRSKPE